MPHSLRRMFGLLWVQCELEKKNFRDPRSNKVDTFFTFHRIFLPQRASSYSATWRRTLHSSTRGAATFSRFLILEPHFFFGFDGEKLEPHTPTRKWMRFFFTARKIFPLCTFFFTLKPLFRVALLRLFFFTCNFPQVSLIDHQKAHAHDRRHLNHFGTRRAIL